MDEAARSILRGNDQGGYSVPRKGLYPFQWNWDSALCALGWFTFDERRGWQELETLFTGQWDCGMVPHIVFHKPSDTYFPGPDVWRAKSAAGIPTSGITQPPVAGTALRRMYENAVDKNQAVEKLRLLFPKVLAFNRWFHEQRDPHNVGLVAIYHPWESGRDNAVEWDEALGRVSVENLEPYQRRDTSHIDAAQRPSSDQYDRFVALLQLFRDHEYDSLKLYSLTPFKVADVGINSILMRADRDLLHLASVLGDSAAMGELQQWLTISTAAFDRLWNEDGQSFCSLDLVSDKHTSTSVSSGSFMCFYAGTGSSVQRQKMIEHLHNLSSAGQCYLVPSLSPDDSNFDSKRYWRGPVWAIVNFIIATGLADEGYDMEADLIGKNTRTLLETAGFMEYFDPLTRAGLGGDTFSWTASMWLCWLTHISNNDSTP